MPTARRSGRLWVVIHNRRELRRALGVGRGSSAKEISNSAVECSQLRVVGLGDIDAGALVQRDDEVHEIHRIEIKRLAQILVAGQRGEIGLGRDPADDVLDQGI